MANELTYQSVFTGQEMDERFAAVAQLQAALLEVETALSAKYVKPASGIPETDLDSAVQSALAKARSAVQDLSNYYTKTEIDSLLAAVNSQEYVDVATLPTASASTLGKIYLVGPTDNQYDRYYTSYDGSDYSWVAAGSTEINLSNYATKAELNQLDQEVDVLIAGEETVNTTTDNYTPSSYQNQVVEDPRQVLPAGAKLLGVNFLSTGSQNSGGASEVRIYDSSRTLVKTITLQKIGATDTYFDLSGEGITIQEGYHYAVYRVGYKWVSGLSHCVNPANGNAYSSSFFGFTWRYGVIVPAYAAPIASLDTRVTNMTEKNTIDLTGLSSEELEVTSIPGYFIGTSGTVTANNDFSYTTPIRLTKGQTVLMYAVGYQTNVAMISEVLTPGSSYKPILISVTGESRYVCVIPKTADYAFCYKNYDVHRFFVINNSIAYLASKVAEIPENSATRLFCGIPTVGIIGDSMSCGAGYNPNDEQAHEYPQYSWWKYLERESGMTYRRFARGGQSTKSFLTDNDYGLPATLTSANFCKLYVIALEINDRTGSGLGPSYLGTSADIDLSDPDNNADSYYGNYARIIQKITAANPSARFMLFTNPRTDGDFNDAIRAIAGMFSNCFLVDLYEKYHAMFVAGGIFYQFQDQSSHYPALAYQGMSKIFSDAMDECIANNVEGFASIQY